MQAHAHIEPEKRKASMEVGHSLPSLPPFPPLLVVHKGSSVLRSAVPVSQGQQLPLKQGSSLPGGGAPRAKWKSPRKGNT